MCVSASRITSIKTVIRPNVEMTNVPERVRYFMRRCLISYAYPFPPTVNPPAVRANKPVIIFTLLKLSVKSKAVSVLTTSHFCSSPSHTNFNQVLHNKQSGYIVSSHKKNLRHLPAKILYPEPPSPL